jgi:hypothetical protein
MNVKTERHCKIITGSVGDDESADGDGAYDLLDVEGTPEEVGKAIADSLREGFMIRGTRGPCFPDDAPMFIRLTVRVCRDKETSDAQDDEHNARDDDGDMPDGIIVPALGTHERRTDGFQCVAS